MGWPWQFGGAGPARLPERSALARPAAAAAQTTRFQTRTDSGGVEKSAEGRRNNSDFGLFQQYLLICSISVVASVFYGSVLILRRFEFSAVSSSAER